ncbi:MAG: hypothetical protein OCD01_11440 [Fibrobacterales bacterium]
MKNLYYRLRGLPPLLLLLSLGYIGANIDNKLNTYALGVIMISQFIRNWSRTYIGGHSRGPDLQAPQLQKYGPYSISRNPLYVSNILFGLGLILLLNIWGIGVIVIFLLYVWHYTTLVSIEEKFLKEKFAKMYYEWARETPRYFAGVSRFSEGVPERTFFEALKSDTTTWVLQWLMVFICLLISV